MRSTRDHRHRAVRARSIATPCCGISQDRIPDGRGWSRRRFWFQIPLFHNLLQVFGLAA